jgi:hypothetical protein
MTSHVNLRFQSDGFFLKLLECTSNKNLLNLNLRFFLSLESADLKTLFFNVLPYLNFFVTGAHLRNGSGFIMMMECQRECITR